MAAPDVEKLVPDRRLSLDGQVLAPDVQARISRISVELSEDLFNQCTITFTDPDLALINGKELAAGVGVFVELGYQGDLKAVFEGEIVSVEPRFVRDKPPSVVVRALERLHRLALAPNTRAFNDVDASQIVKKIAQEHGLSGDAPAGSKGHLLQANISDFQLIKKIASRTGTRITLDGKKLTLGPPPSLGEMELLPGQGVKRLKVKLRTTEQVQKVFVRGWDPKQKKEIVGQASAAGELADGGKEAKTFDRGDLYIEGVLVADTKEAETIAKAAVSRIAERFANAEGELLGDADLLPGRLMNFDKFGELIDGKYRATATRHEFDKRGYRVQFNATRVAKKKPAVPFKSDAKPLEEKSFIAFTLVDTEGKPLAGVSVTVDIAGEGKKSGVTNGAGGVRFGNIKKDASYTVTFKEPGAEDEAPTEDESTTGSTDSTTSETSETPSSEGGSEASETASDETSSEETPTEDSPGDAPTEETPGEEPSTEEQEEETEETPPLEGGVYEELLEKKNKSAWKKLEDSNRICLGLQPEDKPVEAPDAVQWAFSKPLEIELAGVRQQEKDGQVDEHEIADGLRMERIPRRAKLHVLDAATQKPLSQPRKFRDSIELQWMPNVKEIILEVALPSGRKEWRRTVVLPESEDDVGLSFVLLSRAD